MDRQCSRPACAEPAAATLTYVYAKGAAWLDVLIVERDPHSYDLCERHASRVGVPVGWRLEDRRSVLVGSGLIVAGAPAVDGPVPLPAPVPEALVQGLPHRLAG